MPLQYPVLMVFVCTQLALLQTNFYWTFFTVTWTKPINYKQFELLFSCMNTFIARSVLIYKKNGFDTFVFSFILLCTILPYVICIVKVTIYYTAAGSAFDISDSDKNKNPHEDTTDLRPSWKTLKRIFWILHIARFCFQENPLKKCVPQPTATACSVLNILCA